MVITGAGSGIGRALACRLRGCGAAMMLSDADVDGLTETARLCSKHNADVDLSDLDVASPDFVATYADDVVNRHGVPSLVFNNAGITMVAGILEEDPAYARRVMAVNLGGVVHGTGAFLPHLLRAGSGHIVNTSSAFGLLGSPAQSTYCASKFAVRGFTESVQAELRQQGSPVRVHAVFPGTVHSGIARHAWFADQESAGYVTAGFDHVLPATRPSAAAMSILAGVLAGRDRILVGADARVLDVSVRILGGGLLRPAATLTRPIFRRVIEGKESR